MKEPSNTSESMAPETISDAACVRRLQRGDINAFETLVRRHEKAIFNLVYRMLGDYDDAAEVSQEVFLSAYRAIAQFRGDANFSTWLYRIALNHATTRRKSTNSRQKRLVPFDAAEMIDDGQIGPAETLEKKELRDEDVARMLEIPVGTVKSRLHRARQALKARLAAYFSAGRKVI